MTRSEERRDISSGQIAPLAPVRGAAPLAERMGSAAPRSVGRPIPLGLKAARKLAGFTQSQLAAKSGYSTSYIAKIEQRYKRVCQGEKVDLLVSHLAACRIASFLVTPDWPDGMPIDLFYRVERAGSRRLLTNRSSLVSIQGARRSVADRGQAPLSAEGDQRRSPLSPRRRGAANIPPTVPPVTTFGEVPHV